jgi:hypothetical protein
LQGKCEQACSHTVKIPVIAAALRFIGDVQHCGMLSFGLEDESMRFSASN